MGATENKILVGAPITVYAFSRTPPRKSGPCGAVRCEAGWGGFCLGGLSGFAWESFFESIDNARDAVLDQSDVEIDQ
jgi:hypothetical protein